MLTTFEIVLILVFSIAIMWCGTLVQMKWYGISLRWKLPINLFVVIMVIGIGIYGSYWMYLIENGVWGGRSLYGFIFFSPIVYFPIAKIIRVRYRDFLDVCTPCIYFDLALSKILCILKACCEGKILYQNEDYVYVRFPSREVEMAVLFVLALALFGLAKIKRVRGRIYPISLVMYGVVRFPLSYWRDDCSPFAWGLPAGAFWSVWAVCIGLFWILADVYMMRRKGDAFGRG